MGAKNETVDLSTVQAVLGDVETTIKSAIKESADKNAANIDAVKASMATMEAEQVKASERIDALANDVTEMKTSAARSKLFGDGGEHTKSIGQRFIESDAFKAYQESRNAERSGTVTIKGGWLSTKSTLTTGDTHPQARRLDGVFGGRPAPTRVRDLIGPEQTEESVIDYVREEKYNALFGELHTNITAGAAVVLKLKMPADGSDYAGAAGFYVGQTITVGDGSPGEENAKITAVNTNANPHEITVDSLSNSHNAGVAITADEFTFTAETKVKPRGRAKFELISEPVKTIASWIPISKQASRSSTQVVSHIEGRLKGKVHFSEEVALLYGPGGSGSIQGLMTDAAVPSFAWSNGVAGDTKIDCLMHAITIAMQDELVPDAIVLNPFDWNEIRGTKTDEVNNTGAYVLPDAVTTSGPASLFGLPVVVTNAIRYGDALVGSFNLGCYLYEVDGIDIAVSNSDRDNFITNKLTLLGEEGIIFTITVPEAFCKVSFDSAP